MVIQENLSLIEDNNLGQENINNYNLRQNDINLLKTTPYSPWANGEIEWLNRCLKKVNQCAYLENKDCREELNKFLLLYRTSPPQTLSAVPTTLLFNRHVRNGIQWFIDTKTQKNQTDKIDLNRKANKTVHRPETSCKRDWVGKGRCGISKEYAQIKQIIHPLVKKNI